MALLVLIGGCLTLATLVLVHYERRAAELATKTALGATRPQLLAELSKELAVVAIAGTAVAVFVAQLALRAMPALSLPGGLDLGRLDLSPDWRVLSVALAATFVTCALAAWLPLARFTRGTLARTLLAGPAATASPATQRLRQLLLAAQVCAAVIVLASAALFVRTVLYGFSGAAGFDVDHTLFVRSAVTTGFALPSVSDIPTFVATADGRKQRIRDALLQLPGVQQVVDGLPPIGPESVRGLQHPTVVTTERGQQAVRAGWVWDADVDWLSALGVRMLAGRDLRADNARVSPQRVVVTASLANRLWHGGNPLGEKITTPALKGIVVGVSSDFVYGSLLEPAMGTVVTAYHRNTGYLGQWVIRADNALALAGAVEQAVRTAVPDVASVQVQTGRDVVAQDLGQQRVGAWFFSGFGLVALILGVGSVFGLVAYLAESRQREFGVRLALGATASRLMTHGLGAALVPVAVGVVIGLGLSALVAQLFTSALVGVGALDPWAYSAIAVAMLGGAALAALMAAANRAHRRASESLTLTPIAMARGVRRMRTSVVLAIVTAALFVAGPRLVARQRPSLSGTWTFLESQVTRRNGQVAPAHILFVDGAGFNCRAACTIVQDGRTLRVSRPEEKGKKPRDIVLTFASSGTGAQSAHDGDATARWDGQQLLVTNSMGTMTIHQTIAVQKDRMIVTSQMTTGTTPGEIWRQTYVRR